MRTPAQSTPGDMPFHHEALMYDGPDAFLARTSALIRGALAADEPVMVALRTHQIENLREELGREAERVRFADMVELGRNPARIIPAWRDFVDERPTEDVRVWGIGEPIWAERDSEELLECQRHESLLNVAFADTPNFVLLCPYDTGALEAAVLEEARQSHPYLTERGLHRRHEARSLEDSAGPFDAALPDPPGDHQERAFSAETLGPLRRYVYLRSMAAGVRPARSDDAVLAVHEVASNSVRHGGGHGVLRSWEGERTVVFEIRDSGRIDDPLVGRVRPSVEQSRRFGLWLVNQLFDRVQIRTFPSGSVIRVHVPREA